MGITQQLNKAVLSLLAATGLAACSQQQYAMPAASTTVATAATPIASGTPFAEATPFPTPIPTAQPTATPTPTATPITIATATPTPTPTAAPTATPTPTPTATPIATPVPTATPVATATPSPTATPAPFPFSPNATTQICSGVYADATGVYPAAAAIQFCLNQLASGGELDLPIGTYDIDQMLTLKTSNVTIRTQGQAGSSTACTLTSPVTCTVLRAASTLSAAAIFTSSSGVQGITLDHLSFNGNRANRINLAATLCPQAGGRDVILTDVAGTTVENSSFENALCGSGLAVATDGNVSSGFNVRNSIFTDNGDHSQIGQLADGMTIGSISNSSITSSTFTDNSNVDLIMGGGANTTVSGNTFTQTGAILAPATTAQTIYAAFVATNWTVNEAVSSQQWANFVGFNFTENTIDLSFFGDIAIQVGVLPWAGESNIATLRVAGGTYSGNTIEAYDQGINVAGGGTPANPVTIGSNTFQTFQIGPIGPIGPINIEVLKMQSDESAIQFPVDVNFDVTTSLLNIQNPGSDSFVTTSLTGATDYNWDGMITYQSSLAP